MSSLFARVGEELVEPVGGQEVLRVAGQVGQVADFQEGSATLARLSRETITEGSTIWLILGPSPFRMRKATLTTASPVRTDGVVVPKYGYSGFANAQEENPWLDPSSAIGGTSIPDSSKALRMPTPIVPACSTASTPAGLVARNFWTSAWAVAGWKNPVTVPATLMSGQFSRTASMPWAAKVETGMPGMPSTRRTLPLPPRPLPCRP